MRTIVCTVLVGLSLAFAQSFPDVASNHWSQPAIEELVDLGIFVGYPDGFFRGQESISREQVATLLSRLLYAIDETRVKSLYKNLAELEATLALLENNMLAADTKLQLDLAATQTAQQLQNETTAAQQAQMEAQAAYELAELLATSGDELALEQATLKSDLDALLVIVNEGLDDLASVDNDLHALRVQVTEMGLNIPQIADIQTLWAGEVTTMYSNLLILENLIYENQVMFENALIDTTLEAMDILRAEFNEQLLEEVTRITSQLSALELRLKNETVAYVSERLAVQSEVIANELVKVETSVNTRVDNQREQLNSVTNDVNGIKALLNEPRPALYEVRLQAGGGVVGEQASFELNLEAKTGSTLISGHSAAGRFDLLAEHDLSDNFSVGGRYHNTFGGIFLEGHLESGLGGRFEFGYGNSPEIALSVFHDANESRILPGLKLSSSLRARFGDSLGPVLTTLSAAYTLPFGKMTVTPALHYRNLSGSYQGVVISLGVATIVNDIGVSGQLSYGQFQDLTGGEGRGAPEGVLEVSWQTFTLRAVLESNLGQPSRFVDYGDDPLVRSGYKLGLNILIEMDLTGYGETIGGEE